MYTYIYIYVYIHTRGRGRAVAVAVVTPPPGRPSSSAVCSFSGWPLLGALDHTFLITLRVGRADSLVEQ